MNEAEKNAARREVERLVLAGEVLKLPCAQCGNVRVIPHHPDPRFPRVVVWLCRKDYREVVGSSPLAREIPAPPRQGRALELAELRALINRHEDRP